MAEKIEKMSNQMVWNISYLKFTSHCPHCLFFFLQLSTNQDKIVDTILNLMNIVLID